MPFDVSDVSTGEWIVIALLIIVVLVMVSA